MNWTGAAELEIKEKGIMYFMQGCETESEKLEGEIGLATLVAAYDLADASNKDPGAVLKAFRGKEQALFQRIEECGIEPFSSFLH